VNIAVLEATEEAGRMAEALTRGLTARTLDAAICFESDKILDRAN
jgi:hypothetical protein